MKIKDSVKIFLWDILNPGILRLKKRKKYKLKSKYIGINLGCGIENPSDYLGIDGGITHYLIHRLPTFVIKPFFKGLNMSGKYSFDEYMSKIKGFQFIHHELLFGIPFKNNEINNIYSSHFFEHLFKNKAEFLLKECYRVMRPNGIIRICVPSLDESVDGIKYAIEEFEKGNVVEIQKYITSNIIGYNSMYSNHRWMYNFNELSKLLRDAGFKEIKEYSAGVGQIPNVESLDTRGGLFVEARKQ